MGIEHYGMHSGRFIAEDGTVVNIANILSYGKEGIPGITADISSYGISSGRFIREDGTVVNIADMIKNGEIGGGGGSGTSEIKITDHTSEEVTVAIDPAVYHRWGEMDELNITLTPPEKTDVVNEYIFEFTSGTTPTHLTLPATVKGVPVIEANSRYQISIVDNMLAHGRWDVNATT